MEKVITDNDDLSSVLLNLIHGKMTGKEKCGRKGYTTHSDDGNLKRIFKQS